MALSALSRYVVPILYIVNYQSGQRIQHVTLMKRATPLSHEVRPLDLMSAIRSRSHSITGSSIQASCIICEW
jgi:hypothetical protein